MKELAKLFDTYSLHARVKPAFIVAFPVVIAVFTFFEPSRSWGGLATTFITTFGIISFAANQISTRGNILQDKLFSKWGGAPTTIILRHSDARLDKHTKERYKEKLEHLICNFKPVSQALETQDMSLADEMYRTAAVFMKEQTRDTKKHPLVFKENISYGFSRNVRSFKWLGFTVSFSTATISSFIVWYKYINGNEKPFLDLIFNIPFEYMAVLGLLSLFPMLWIFLVTEKWVEIRAFAYAKALYTACDK